MNFTYRKFEKVSKKLNMFLEMVSNLISKKNIEYSSSEVPKLIETISPIFEKNMGNDLNVKNAFDNVFEIIKELNSLKMDGKISDKDSSRINDIIHRIDEVLKVIFTN